MRGAVAWAIGRLWCRLDVSWAVGRIVGWRLGWLNRWFVGRVMGWRVSRRIRVEALTLQVFESCVPIHRHEAE